VRRRFLKAGTAISIGIACTLATTYKMWGYTGLLSFIGVSLLLLFFLISPALLDKILDHLKSSKDEQELGLK
jgi:hypothetical protein